MPRVKARAISACSVTVWKTCSPWTTCCALVSTARSTLLNDRLLSALPISRSQKKPKYVGLVSIRYFSPSGVSE